MDEEEKSKVEELSETLYSRTRYQEPTDRRQPVKPREMEDVREKWPSPELDEVLKQERESPPLNPLMRKIFLFSLVFFIAATLAAAYVFFGGSTFVSSKNVDISILGPTSVSAGEPFELNISVLNKNSAALEVANLSIEYPAGSRDSLDAGKSLTYTKEPLGAIEAGEVTVRNARLVLFGAPGEVKELKFSVEYRVEGSGATFYKDKLYELVIGESPVTLLVENPDAVTSGDGFTTRVLLVHHAQEILENVLVKAEYPYGYTVLDVSPPALANNNLWLLGDLAPGDRKSIQIRGRLVGENEEERTFRFYAGVGENGANPNLKTVIVSTLDTVAIARPSLGLVVSFNGESATSYVAPPARPILTTVRFRNNLPDTLISSRLEVRLSGSALDKSSLNVQNGGQYSFSNNRILWGSLLSGGDQELLPGEAGQVAFSFSSLPNLAAGASAREITLEIALIGTPLGGSGPVTVTETRTVRISSQIDLSSQVLYSRGLFANTGPIPPKAGSATTYTVNFKLANIQSEVENAKVTARLGPGIAWLDNFELSGGDISYNESANLVTWQLGDLAVGSGFASGFEGSFQISLTPSTNQIGTAPSLVTDIVFSGFDVFSGSPVNLVNPSLTTRLPNDPAFVGGDDIVVK